MSDPWPRKTKLAQAVYDLGFEYHPDQDIIVSRLDAWQRHVGFMWAYDVMSPAMLMIIDCEPVYFNYGGKEWMIELWKGQYGLETGSEIGVYEANGNPPTIQKVTDTIHSWFPGIAEVADHAQETVRFFSSAGPKDQLMMSYVLSKDGEPFIHRGPESHWWLTGFKWGEFTKNSSQLSMAIEITFPATAMRDAFEKGLRHLGYTGLTTKDSKSIGFTFGKPKTPQPKSRVAAEASAQAANEKLVAGYRALKAEIHAPNNDPNLIDEKLISSKEGKDTYAAIMNFIALMETGKKKMEAIWNAL